MDQIHSPSSFDTTGAATITPECRHQMIATAAYYRAECRAFQAGDPVADWLQAEAEIDRALERSLA